MALLQELSGQSPFAIIEALKKTIDLLGRRLERMVFYSRILGSSIFFVGLIGALVHTLQGFRVAQYFKDVPLGALAVTFSEAIILFLIALFIGLICLAGSYWSRIRLSSLHMIVSDRILKAAEERAVIEMKSEKK
jgi:biopolymer transport protein ExbB/TolQ